MPLAPTERATPIPALLLLLVLWGISSLLDTADALTFLIAGLLGIVTFISHATEVPTSAPTLATMIGLGVGIDYALFIVTRHLSQLAQGMEPRESVARATATSGGAVVFAAGTVIIALLSLAFAGIPIVTTLGYTEGGPRRAQKSPSRRRGRRAGQGLSTAG